MTVYSAVYTVLKKWCNCGFNVMTKFRERAVCGAQDVEVVYRGIESGQIEAVFKQATPESLARPYRTGLDGSAVGGK